MSTYPAQPGQPQSYQPPPTNGLGIAGFIVSLTGMVVCLGLISPVGLLLSLIALFKEPRGFAIAGCIIGVLGTVLGALSVMVVTGAIGAGIFAGALFGNFQTSMTIDVASNDIDNHFMNNNDTLPDEATGNTMISNYLDEWGNTLKYELTANSTTDYTITSAGPDGTFATMDDITQYYTAFNWASPAMPGDFEEEVDETQIENAFNIAAQQIVAAFPAGSDLPTAELVSQKAGGLVDPWLMPMRYSPTSNPPYYRLESAGPDLQWNTPDDITRSFYFAPTGPSDGPL